MSNGHSEDLFAKYGGTEAQLLTIDLMEGHDFEYWCAGLLREIGFSNVEVTPGSNDQGVDILAQKDGVKYAIQCKRYSHDLGNTPVQEVHAGKAMYHCHVGVVMTNQHFTKGAKDLAQATGVLLWDREWIKANLSSNIQDPSTLTNKKFGEYVLVLAAYALVNKHISVEEICNKFSLSKELATDVILELQNKGFIGELENGFTDKIYITEDQWQSLRHSYYQNNHSSDSTKKDNIIFDDDLYEEAVNVIIETHQVSVYIIQRRLNIGYARASRLIDEMERNGIVGPFQGSKPRAVLISKEDWVRKNGSSQIHTICPSSSPRVSPDIDPVLDFCPSDITVELPEPQRTPLFKKSTQDKSRPGPVKKFFLALFSSVDIFLLIVAISMFQKDASTLVAVSGFILPIFVAFVVALNKRSSKFFLNRFSFWIILLLSIFYLISIAAIK